MQNYEPGRGLLFASGVQQGGVNPPWSSAGKNSWKMKIQLNSLNSTKNIFFSKYEELLVCKSFP